MRGAGTRCEKRAAGDRTAARAPSNDLDARAFVSLTSSSPATEIMSRFRLALVAVATAALIAGCSGRAPTPHTTTADAPATTSARPALVVMIVVDQLREPLLERYDDLFTGGFRRLMDHGRFFVNATHDHAVTKTAPGHATLATATYPSRHGIVSNEWDERTAAGWKQVSNVGDSTVKVIGFPEFPGISPHYLMRSGLADWMVAADPRSRVASVSGKDRGAVLPAAHAKGHVYWFDSWAGQFVTSTYYREQYPDWVETFHARELPRYLRDSVWVSQVPASARVRSSPDTAAYEADGIHTYFPHRFVDEGKPDKFWIWFDRTPMLDQLVLDFARTMVTSLELGRDEVPDFLNVSLSQTDRIGHDYGPLSREELDNLLRLDRELGEFFAFLDRTVGAGRWTVGLSADHGSLIAPEDLPTADEKMTGHRQTRAERAALDSIRAEADRHAGDPATPARVVTALRRLPIVAEAWTHEQVGRASPSDSFAVLYQRALYPGRQGEDFDRQGVSVRYIEGFLTYPRGSSHGLPYWYDRHVPMIFMGAGIPAGRDSTRVSTVDFAPTLARQLRIAFPGDLDGHPLGLR